MHIGLDFFDASINRIAAWVIGTRNMKALLRAAGANRSAETAGKQTVTTPRAWRYWKSRNPPAVAGRVGRCTASVTTHQQAASGWKTCGRMKDVLSQRG